MKRLALIGLLSGAFAFAGCGSDESQPSSVSPAKADKRPPPKKSQNEKHAPDPEVEIVATCADLYGQEVFSEAPPVPGFVGCLKRMGGPPWLIKAWGG